MLKKMFLYIRIKQVELVGHYIIIICPVLRNNISYQLSPLIICECTYTIFLLKKRYHLKNLTKVFF